VTLRLYKAAEVCEATGLQPYVLRSWEKEFPSIGVQKSSEAPRFYRESDIEWVRRIKELVFGEGLTLAGARRRLEASLPRPVESSSEMDEVLDTLGADARTRIDIVRSGLRSILEVLSKRAGSMPVPELPRNGSVQKSRPRRTRRKITKRVAAPKRRTASRKGRSKRKRAHA
jgi:DNA-binding transcriptional MerR regulator